MAAFHLIVNQHHNIKIFYIINLGIFYIVNVAQFLNISPLLFLSNRFASLFAPNPVSLIVPLTGIYASL